MDNLQYTGQTKNDKEQYTAGALIAFRLNQNLVYSLLRIQHLKYGHASWQPV